jgi:histone-lysine N-methyltransferase SETMAR
MMMLRHIMKFEVLPHPPYSPDLVPSDFHLFGPLKESLRGCKFNLDDVQLAVHEWLRGQPQEFFSSGIQVLVSCWHKCIELQGNYVEL